VSALVLLAIALITYGSRAAAVVLLPRPGARFEMILSRIPAAIFASLATATLVGDAGWPTSRCWPPRRARYSPARRARCCCA
jgi:branched-subunit amino acid transport protein